SLDGYSFLPIHFPLFFCIIYNKTRCDYPASTTDLYFTSEDCEAEANLIPNAEFLPIPSIWGHRAGNPYQNPVDQAFIRQVVHKLLDT
ncbi:MAG: hypothetical protein ACKO2V_23480, partial [Snowella sp.]